MSATIAAPAPAAHVPADEATKERHVLAERYKTKVCRNFVQNGVCPYEHRCMFAHGDHELRTNEMNLADGLITEEAIKNFQRAQVNRNRQTAAMPARMTMPNQHQQQQDPSGNACQCDECMSYYRHNPYAAYGAAPYYYTKTCECADCLATMYGQNEEEKVAPGAPMQP